MATAKWYYNGLLGQVGGTPARRVDWAGDTIKLSLHTSAYVPNPATHIYYTDLTNELPTAGGYTIGGYTLTGRAVQIGNTNEIQLVSSQPAQWVNATFTFQIYVIRKDTGTPSTSPLLGYCDMGSAQSPAAATYTLQPDPSGWLKLVAI